MDLQETRPVIVLDWDPRSGQAEILIGLAVCTTGNRHPRAAPAMLLAGLSGERTVPARWCGHSQEH